MDTSNSRPDLHVVQQNRRDKLRNHQHAAMANQHPEAYNTHRLGQFSAHQGLNPDSMQFRGYRYDNISYDPSAITSEMLNVVATSTSQALLAEKDASFTHLSVKERGSGPHSCSSTWRSVANDYTCGLAGVECNNNTSQTFVGESLSGAMKIMNTPSAAASTSYFGCHEVQSSLTNQSTEISSQNSQKHYGNMHNDSPSLYQNENTLHEIVTSATVGSQEGKMVCFAPQNTKEIGRHSWTNVGNELVLLPTFSDPCNRSHLNYSSAPRGAVANHGSGTQALSLSLSSVRVANMNADSKSLRSSSHVCCDPKPSINGDKSLVGITSAVNHRNVVGPLGPFTGYATILSCSRFLKPAQELLDECFSMVNPKPTRPIESSVLAHEIRVSSDAINGDSRELGVETVGSGGTSSINENNQEAAGGLGSSNESFHPDYLMKKARLLYMQEEVCRWYKQYHQQMQMVVSSFESVAGLSSATPYISLALKTISRHFRCLKNAISDQLRNTKIALGEDFSSPNAGTSNSKVDTSTSRRKLIEQAFQKQKIGGGSMCFFEPQHVWRPQRGLPERAVAVLRAWLFDHFLHPYPTDADKHILATQTGLTKNQVSNWFINARVRVWKPMVEEIHMLETEGLARSVSNARKTDNEKLCREGVRGRDISQQLNKLSTSCTPDGQTECIIDCGSPSRAENRLNPQMWNPDKRSRVDRHTPANMEGSLVSFMPYQRSGIEIGSLGAISLTLGLRQSAEGSQDQQQLQQSQYHQFMQHVGGHLIHEFG